MRLINCRYVFFNRRRLKLFILLVILFVVVLNLSILKQKPVKLKTTGFTRPWRFMNGIFFTALQTNTSCPSRLVCLILVSSNVGHFDRRHLIRKTWGPDTALKAKWRTVFLLNTNDNKAEMKRLALEERLYGDVVRGRYKESFFNMPFKVAMGFEWAIKSCQFDYLLKTDDDIFVNTHGLLNYLQDSKTARKGLYTGNPMIGSPVLRGGRYKVEYDRGVGRDDQLNKTVFAPYCSGGGFLLSRDVVMAILDLFDLEHPLNIDDAYIGELAERLNVKVLVNPKNFMMYADNCKYNVEAYVQHPAKGECLEKLFAQHTKYLNTGKLPSTPKPSTKPPTKPPIVHTQPPKGATKPPVAHPQPPKKASKPPIAHATQPPKEATKPPVAHPQPPKEASKPPVVHTTQPPKGASKPPIVHATQPPKEATKPPIAHTEPPKEASKPPIAHATQPPKEATKPPVVHTEPPKEVSKPPIAHATQPPKEATKPPVVHTEPPKEASKPPIAHTQPPKEATKSNPKSLPSQRATQSPKVHTQVSK